MYFKLFQTNFSLKCNWSIFLTWNQIHAPRPLFLTAKKGIKWRFRHRVTFNIWNRFTKANFRLSQGFFFQIVHWYVWPKSSLLSKNQSKNYKNCDPLLKSLACLVLEIWRPEHFCDVTGQKKKQKTKKPITEKLLGLTSPEFQVVCSSFLELFLMMDIISIESK